MDLAQQPPGRDLDFRPQEPGDVEVVDLPCGAAGHSIAQLSSASACSSSNRCATRGRDRARRGSRQLRSRWRGILEATGQQESWAASGSGDAERGQQVVGGDRAQPVALAVLGPGGRFHAVVISSCAGSSATGTANSSRRRTPGRCRTPRPRAEGQRAQAEQHQVAGGDGQGGKLRRGRRRAGRPPAAPAAAGARGLARPPPTPPAGAPRLSARIVVRRGWT